MSEHIANDLGVKKGLTLVKAWTRRGYDMDYPDLLPAAEECGGNEGLARSSERVRKLGWLFGLHDNPVILFKESPSTKGEDALVREDGTQVEGGIGIPRWRLYWCCPARMVRYAKNSYPLLKDLFHINYIYSDQVAALPVCECFSPDHPLTHQQTIESYKELVELKRSYVGVVGSEIADEWAVPIFDTMGIAVSTAHQYAYPIPLFELVYRECVNLEPWPWGTLSSTQIINSISRGRMPYLSFPNSNYLRDGFNEEKTKDPWDHWWTQFHSEDNPFLRGDQGWGQHLNRYDRLVKNVYQVTSPLNELTALVQMTDHTFLTTDRKVERATFQDGTTVVVNRSEGDYDYQGTLLPTLGFLITGPIFSAFYAKRHQGVEYHEGALFTVRSLDGKPIPDSSRVSVYHGFGRPDIRIGRRVFAVAREAVLDPQASE